MINGVIDLQAADCIAIERWSKMFDEAQYRLPHKTLSRPTAVSGKRMNKI